jgi:transcription termination factor Rho
LSALNLPALKQLAKDRGLKGTSTMRKGELIEVLSAGAPAASKPAARRKTRVTEEIADQARNDGGSRNDSGNSARESRRARATAENAGQARNDGGVRDDVEIILPERAVVTSAPAESETTERPRQTGRRRASRPAGDTTPRVELNLPERAIGQENDETRAPQESSRGRRNYDRPRREEAVTRTYAESGEGVDRAETTGEVLDREARLARLADAVAGARAGGATAAPATDRDDRAARYERIEAIERASAQQRDRVATEGREENRYEDDRRRRNRDRNRDRNDRNERNNDRNDRNDRNERNNEQHTDRAERAERPERQERQERHERNDRRDRSDRFERKQRRGLDTPGEDIEIREDDVLIPVAGVLDVLDNYAFVRTSGYLPGPNDVYVSLNQVKRNGMRRGDAIVGAIKAPREGEQQGQGQGRNQFSALVRVDSINGLSI